MRIVMACDDIRIDRRILQEAETLVAAGHEVILLATHAEGLPQHEHIGSVKVERLSVPPCSVLEASVLSATVMVGRAALRLKTWLWNAMRRGASRVHEWLVTMPGRAVPRPKAWLQTTLRRGTRRMKISFPSLPWRAVWRLKAWLRYALRYGAARVALVSFVVAAKARKLYLYARKLVIVYPLRLMLRLTYLVRRGSMRDHHLAKRIVYYDPDCIHVHDLPQLRAGVMARKRLHVPLIYDAHELYSEIGSITPLQRIRLRRRERRHIHDAAVTVTVNPLLANVMQERYRLSIVESLLNAVNPPPGFDPRESHDRFRDVLPIPKAARIVLFQGWMSAERGLANIVEAMPSVPQHVHVVFMGYGDESIRLKERAAELGVGDRVHRRTAVPQDELIFWSASADVGIIPYPLDDPNNRLCSPNKLFEFIQAGVPLLVNNSAYLRSVVGGERIGLVRKLDTASDFVDAITEICSSDERLEQFRRRILEVQDKYCWDVQGVELLRIYRSVVPEHMRRAA